MRVMLCWLLICGLRTGVASADEIRATFAMDADPVLQAPDPVKFFPGGYKPLWQQALARPEADLQRLSAETIAQAHAFGFPGMTESRPRLMEILSAEATHPTARFAAARALIVLDSRDAAPALFAAAKRYGADLRQLIEPALGKWKFQPIAEVWRTRLTAADARHRDLMLAIDGAAQLADGTAVPLLLQIVHDQHRSPAARWGAARAVGKIRDSGMEPEAIKLTSGSDVPLLQRLCAVHLLAHHSSEASRTVLLQLAVDREPSIAAVALKRLLELNPDLVVPLAAGAMQNPDPIVRQRGSEAYIARPNPERVVSLVRLLDDPHPTVRGSVREALYVLIKTPEFDVVLRPAIMAMLAADGWRGQEQAALLLGTLDHEAAAPRLVQLLESPRDEVLTTAAWALQKLAIPETLPAIFDKAQRQTTLRESQSPQPGSLDTQVVYLFETMGMMNYQPAEPLFRKHIPKSFGYGQFSRGAAIWALGHLYADRADEALAQQLAERMADVASVPPEMTHVQVMSAVTLGRMRAKAHVPAMRSLLNPSPTHPSMAIRWAIMRITGESLPELQPERYSKSAWFLTPLDNSPDKPAP